MRRTAVTTLAGILAAALAVGAAACGDDDTGDVIDSGRETAQAIPTGINGGDDGDGSTPEEGGSQGGTRLEIAAENSEEFTKDTLEASPGTVTVVFLNNDAGVVHNIHVFDGTDADAATLASTELETGPVEQELTFRVDEGEYFYHCDAHPQMQGTLVVSE